MNMSSPVHSHAKMNVCSCLVFLAGFCFDARPVHSSPMQSVPFVGSMCKPIGQKHCASPSMMAQKWEQVPLSPHCWSAAECTMITPIIHLKHSQHILLFLHTCLCKLRLDKYDSNATLVPKCHTFAGFSIGIESKTSLTVTGEWALFVHAVLLTVVYSFTLIDICKASILHTSIVS